MTEKKRWPSYLKRHYHFMPLFLWTEATRKQATRPFLLPFSFFIFCLEKSLFETSNKYLLFQREKAKNFLLLFPDGNTNFSSPRLKLVLTQLLCSLETVNFLTSKRDAFFLSNTSRLKMEKKEGKNISRLCSPVQRAVRSNDP